MAFKLANRAVQTSTSIGTGTLSLDAPATGLQSIVSAIGDGHDAPAFILNTDGEWEASRITVTAGTPDTITRGEVFESTNGGAKVNFAAGTKTIWIGPVAQLMIMFASAPTLADGQVPQRVSGAWVVKTATEIFQTIAGKILLNDTAWADGTVGICINQGANDDQAFALKSSDVAHALTSVAETDSYFSFSKFDGATGGSRVRGIAESTAKVGIGVDAFAGQPDTTPSTAITTLSTIWLRARPHDGANAFVDHSANALVFGVAARVGGADRNVFFVDEDGDLHVDGSTTPSAFDTYADAELIRAFALETADPAQIVRSKWDEVVRYGRDALIKAGILSEPKDGGDSMVNVTQLQRLHTGAIWQLHCENQKLREQINAIAATLVKLLPKDGR